MQLPRCVTIFPATLLLGGNLIFARPALAAAPADLKPIIARAAKYQSGEDGQALRQIENRLREAIADPSLRPDLEAGLVGLVGEDATYEARRFACQQLAIIGTVQSLPALSNLLKRAETAELACLALSGHPAPGASAVLRDALPRLTGQPRLQVINVLGNRRDAASVPALMALTRDSDAATAEAAVAALGKIASADAAQAIATMRPTAPPSLAPAVLDASFRLAERLATSDAPASAALYQELLKPGQPPYARRGALGNLLALEGDQAERRILEVLRGADAALKPVAIAGIRSLKAPGTSERFGQELAKLGPQEQVWLIDALADRGDSASRDVITRAIAAEAPTVRQAAIAAVGRLGEADSVAPLAKALADAKSSEERALVEQALVNLGGKQATDRTIVAQLKSSNPLPRSHLITALARRDSRSAVPVLLEEAGSADSAVAQAAFRALASLAEARHLPPLLDKLEQLRASEERASAEEAVVQVLGKVEAPPRRTEAVCQRLEKASGVETRCSLLRLLPSAAGPRALQAVHLAMTDAEPRIRDTAIRALADWPDDSAWDSLMQQYAQPTTEAYRVLALRALVRLAREDNTLPTGPLMDWYRQLLANARNDDDKKLVLGALAGVAHADALALALPLLSNPGTRAEAEVAVKKIAEAIKATHPQAAQEALRKLQ
jgi:HEAT repeat protein